MIRIQPNAPKPDVSPQQAKVYNEITAQMTARMKNNPQGYQVSTEAKRLMWPNETNSPPVIEVYAREFLSDLKPDQFNAFKTRFGNNNIFTAVMDISVSLTHSGDIKGATSLEKAFIAIITDTKNWPPERIAKLDKYINSEEFKAMSPSQRAAKLQGILEGNPIPETGGTEIAGPPGPHQ